MATATKATAAKYAGTTNRIPASMGRMQEGRRGDESSTDDCRSLLESQAYVHDWLCSWASLSVELKPRSSSRTQASAGRVGRGALATVARRWVRSGLAPRDGPLRQVSRAAGGSTLRRRVVG
jgi:hypothetical protein